MMDELREFQERARELKNDVREFQKREIPSQAMYDDDRNERVNQARHHLQKARENLEELADKHDDGFYSDEEYND